MHNHKYVRLNSRMKNKSAHRIEYHPDIRYTQRPLDLFKTVKNEHRYIFPK